MVQENTMSETKTKKSKDDESIIIAHRKIILEEHKVDIITIPNGIKFDSRPMFMFDKETGCWTNTARDFIQKYCSAIEDLDTKTDLNNLINNIQGQTTIDAEKFHPKENMINLRNGYINLETMQFHEGHSDECKLYYFKNMLPIDYEDKPKEPKEFFKILNIVLPDNKDQCLLQEIYGVTISDMLPKNLVVFKGYPDTFKSTTGRIIEFLVGKENSTNNTIEDLTTSKDRALNIAGLDGKKLNITYDMENQYIKETGTLKSLSSGGTDSLRGRNHFEGPISIVPRVKTILIGNRYSKTSKKVDEDDAFWIRVIILLFKTKVPIGSITLERDFETAFKKYYEPEASGIFKWALEGLIRYKKNGKFSFDGDAFSMWHADEGEEKPFEYFIDTYFDFPIDGEIRQTPTEVVQELCKIYCNDMKEVYPGRDNLGRHISNLGWGINKAQSRKFNFDKSKTEVYDGIVPKESKIKMLSVSNPEMYNKYIKYYEEHYAKYCDSHSAKPVILFA
jgi:hypothetical protein